MTSSFETALQLLDESCNLDRDARIWHDNGRTIGRLARTARVLVYYVHVDLAAGTVEHRTADGREVTA